jgi:hypothetical protein
MNSLSNLSKKLAIPATLVLAAHFSAIAQNPVESTHVDEKYAYTTVVYKNKAANDQEVLSSIESEFGIGDVIRVTLAPPPTPISAIAASEPVYADKKKGEDTWMPGTVQSADHLVASSQTATMPKTSVSTIPVSSKTTPIMAKSAAPTKIVVAKTVVPEVLNQVNVVDSQQLNAEASVAEAETTAFKANSNTKVAASGKSSKANKSVKKSSKKGGQKMKFKKRKHSKQRYACPKF